ncbi:hypothetical protein OCU04_005032 [Sclerotinia nivalis]|uniref:Uncharacterized protein n=1 Tax=Sclerotinia nivalis TaxID=352851 RepID=A0A9X0AP37_9HELO|nr:hypothetical protein OCU04_005032 [Sclerotinia nivalis]
MNLAFSSHMATLKPMSSSFVNSSASLPTAISSILNSTSANGTFCYIATTTNRWRVSMPTVTLVALILLEIILIIFLSISRFELSKTRAQADCLEYEKIHRFEEGLKSYRQKIWEENYQQDASRVVKIRTLAQDSIAAVNPESRVYYMAGFAAAMKEVHHILIEKFVERYGTPPSQIEEDREGKFGPVPRYRPEDDATIA